MNCVRCGKKIENPVNPFHPFCSDRCRLLDLDKWISGQYRISSENSEGNRNEKSDEQEDPDKE